MSSKVSLTPCKTQLFSSTHTVSTYEELKAQTLRCVETCRLETQPGQHQDAIAANIPFDWVPKNFSGKKGVILIHGLLDSPFTMWNLADFFFNQGFYTRGLLLPGHGTRPGDLLNCKLEQWQETLRLAIEDLKTQVEEIYLLGFSLGGSLALESALTETALKGLMIFAPSLRLKHPLAPLSGTIARWCALSKQQIWLQRQCYEDYARYHEYPPNLAYQSYQLSKLLRTKLEDKTINTATLLVVSEQDETICSKTALEYFKNWHNPLNQAVYYSSCFEESTYQNIEFRSSYFPSENILDFSHISLIISPANFHYGRVGDQKAEIYEPRNNLDSTIYQGAISKYNRQHFRLKRLSYNPDFDYLLEKIAAFINSVSN